MDVVPTNVGVGTITVNDDSNSNVWVVDTPATDTTSHKNPSHGNIMLPGTGIRCWNTSLKVTKCYSYTCDCLLWIGIIMANTTSGAYSFDQDFSIDEIIADAYERIGLVGTAGHQLKTATKIFKYSFSRMGQ